LSLPKGCLRRKLHYVLAIGCPLLVAIAVSVRFAPMALTRVDDGDRSARLIEGNGVNLCLGPQGTGMELETALGRVSLLGSPCPLWRATGRLR